MLRAFAWLANNKRCVGKRVDDVDSLLEPLLWPRSYSPTHVNLIAATAKFGAAAIPLSSIFVTKTETGIVCCEVYNTSNIHLILLQVQVKQ